MLPSPLVTTTADNIMNLIDSEVAESLTLEYKRELPRDQTEAKREFACDVAAMANAAGGDLIFGVVDRRGVDNQSTGVAERLAGMKLPNAQAEIARLSNLIRDSITPRLVGITMQDIACPDGDVLVIRIPKSWNKPHMVTFGGANKFFGRVSTGKYPMSIDEIRRAFSEQSELTEIISRWRSHRAEITLRNEGPIPVVGPVTMLFHAIPASAFSNDVLRESWTIPEQEQMRLYVPNRITTYRYNADGFIGLANLGDTSPAFGYTQLFRSGITEYADSHCFGPVNGGSSMIYGQEIEKQMVECYEDAITRFRKQGRTEPLYVGFSLVGIANKTFFSTLMQSMFSQSFIRTDIFTSPEVFVDINESEERPYRKTLLPLADTMWQVTGRAGTPFKSNGIWEPFKRYN